MVTRTDVLTLNGTPYVVRRRVWVGRFVDNLTGQTRNELIELWKEYTESDQVYQEGEALFFLQEIKEPEWEEII
jgi:DNA-binding SARP family transcriptional activator